MTLTSGVNPAVRPSGTGCVECEAIGGWWFHLRRCAQCGHIGCCDTSPSQHATAHGKTGHPVIRSFEPGEAWFCCYGRTRCMTAGPPWRHRSIIRPASQYPARRAAFPATGRPTCTTSSPVHRRAGDVAQRVDAGGLVNVPRRGLERRVRRRPRSTARSLRTFAKTLVSRVPADRSAAGGRNVGACAHRWWPSPGQCRPGPWN